MSKQEVRPPKPKNCENEIPNGIPLYGTCPTGEFWVLYESVARVVFEGRGYRAVISFKVLNDERSEPLCDDEGDPYFAVIVCNYAKTDNPKSVLFKVRKAVLCADEFDPIDNAASVPEWDHFKSRRGNGERRFLKARVERAVGPNGHELSLVRAIQQPRDNEWFTVKQTFDGLPFVLPHWLNKDGTVKAIKDSDLEKLPGEEQHAILAWPTLNVENFRELTPDEVAVLDTYELSRYELKKLKFEIQKLAEKKEKTNG